MEQIEKCYVRVAEKGVYAKGCFKGNFPFFLTRLLDLTPNNLVQFRPPPHNRQI